MIKKTSMTTPTSAQIVDGYGTSTTDGYSQNYINNNFGGKILWTNSSPSSNFEVQDITLNSNDYDILEMYVLFDKNGIQTKSFKIIKGQSFWIDFYSGYDSKGAFRPINYVDDTTYHSLGAFWNSGSASNNYCIPLYIIGYKTNLFN